jgi:DNA-binding NtrC family response regulator
LPRDAGQQATEVQETATHGERPAVAQRSMWNQTNVTMQREIIFVATNDAAFEKVATDAIMEMRHGMRRTGNPRDVWSLLTREDEVIAAAVIDVDFESCGLFLLHVIGHAEPAFPVLAVTANPDMFLPGEVACPHFIHYLKKPVTVGELRKKLQDLCNAGNLPTMPAMRGTSP